MQANRRMRHVPFYRRSVVLSKSRSQRSLDGFLSEASPGQVPGGADAGSTALDQPGCPLRLPAQAGDCFRHELVGDALLLEAVPDRRIAVPPLRPSLGRGAAQAGFVDEPGPGTG